MLISLNINAKLELVVSFKLHQLKERLLQSDTSNICSRVGLKVYSSGVFY